MVKVLAKLALILLTVFKVGEMMTRSLTYTRIISP